MLRLFALLLLAANALFFAWSKGYLSPWGFASTSKTELFRVNEQIEPERIVISRKNVLAATASPAPVLAPVAMAKQTPIATTTSCVTAGVFNDIQSAVLMQTLSAKLPGISWRFDTANVPARWIVYLGKYPNNAARDFKKSQLDQIKIRYEVLKEGYLEPGLSLGSHDTQVAANLALQQLFKQGVYTARVLQESPEQKAQTLVVPAVDELGRSKLNAVFASLAPQLANKTLQVCSFTSAVDN